MRNTVFACIATAAVAHAQDLLLVDSTGVLVAADSRSALTALRVGGGTSGLRALATDGVALWGVANGSLMKIDRLTLDVQAIAPIVDYLSLAWDQASTALYGLRRPATNGSTQVDRIDRTTGSGTPVAAWSLPFPTALAVHQGTMVAWDAMSGLIRVDLAVGTGTPVGPPSGFHNVEYLCSHPDGRLLAGIQFGLGSDLGQVDLATGQLTSVAHFTGLAIVSGVALGPARRVYGRPCFDVTAAPTLTLQGNCRAGTVLTVSSTGHATGAPGAMIFGLSTTNWRGVPLPLLLDPVLGTNGCSLYVSVDATLFGIAASVPPAALTFSFLLPPGMQGFTFAMQHATLSPVPGSSSWSNAVEQTVLAP